MTKWGDKHMYNWREWMRSLYNLPDKINSWSIDQLSPDRFIVFMLNMLILRGLCYTTMLLMAIPQTIEWAMKNLMDEVNKLGRGKGEGIKHHIRDFTYVMLGLFVAIPYAVTWGLPKLIGEVRQNKVEKRLQKQAEELRQTEEDTRQWGAIVDGVIREQELASSMNIFTKHKKDFKPKKKIKAHSLVKSPLVFRSPGVFTIERDYSYIGYEEAYEQYRAILERVRERRVRLNRRTRREAEYYNNIGNE